MKIKIQDYNDAVVMELQGELTGDSTELFHSKTRELIAGEKAGIVLDMSNVGFIDSEGLEQLLCLRDSCCENDLQLKLAGLDENC